jgi:hypothetical protein
MLRFVSSNENEVYGKINSTGGIVAGTGVPAFGGDWSVDAGSGRSVYQERVGYILQPGKGCVE